MPKVHRHNDKRLCGGLTISTTTTVFVNGKAISREGDLNNHGGGLLKASTTTVYAEGKKVSGVLDKGLPDSSGHPKTDALTGSPSVSVGL